MKEKCRLLEYSVLHNVRTVHKYIILLFTGQRLKRARLALQSAATRMVRRVRQKCKWCTVVLEYSRTQLQLAS